jgi:hypothetical protein
MSAARVSGEREGGIQEENSIQVWLLFLEEEEEEEEGLGR